MIVGTIKRGQLADYNLGDLDAPSDTVLKIKEYDKLLEIIWNEDDNRWEFYRLEHKAPVITEDVLRWQISAPVFGSEISPGIVDWLKKYNDTAGFTLDKEQREKRTLELFKQALYNQRIRQQKELNDRYYEVKHRCEFIANLVFGCKQIVVPAGNPIGINKNGKSIRAYKPVKRSF